MARYPTNGHADGRGTAAEPMGEAIDKGLQHLTEADVASVATYLRSVPAISSPDLPAPSVETAPAVYDLPANLATNRLGRRVLEQACVSCHGWTGRSSLSRF